jgi:hypothetical protein
MSLGGPLGLALAAAALAGCGSDQKRLHTAEASSLRAELLAAKTAAARGSRAGALAELARFEARTEQLAAAGRLASDDARALRVGVQQALAAVRRELPAAVVPSARTTPSPPVPAPAAKPASHDPHQGKGSKGEHPKGHGKGHEGGD